MAEPGFRPAWEAPMREYVKILDAAVKCAGTQFLRHQSRLWASVPVSSVAAPKVKSSVMTR